MSFWAHLWNRLKAIPVGVWAALGVATTLLGLFLRGKRLEAELAQSKLKEEASKAAVTGALSMGKAQVHLERAGEHAAKAALIEAQLLNIKDQGETEQKRLRAMPPSQVTDEYLKMLRGKQP